MLVKLAIAIHAIAAIASPVDVYKRQDPDTGLTWISKDSSLPKIMLYNSGDGTILSGSCYGRLDNVNYGGCVGGVSPEGLIAQVPEVLDIAQIAVFSSTPQTSSSDASSMRFLNISLDANARLCSEGSDIVGAVMIHGTNTLAETAFGIDLTFNCSKPFVTSGSMRPNSAISPDGPSNFYNAVRTAVHPEARDRGGMMSFNDHLVSTFYATKTNANSVTTFLAFDQGYIAQFLGGQPYFYFGPSLPKARNYFDPATLALPPRRVDIIYAHQEMDAGLIYAAAANGAQGIVYMGPGPGGVSTNASAAIATLYDQGVYTVVAHRTLLGANPPSPTPGNYIHSGYLTGEQARIQLQLSLAAGNDFNSTRRLFEEEIFNAAYNTATAYYNATDTY